MKKDKLDCIGYVDGPLIEKAEHYFSVRKRNAWVKRGAKVACFAAVVVAAVSILPNYLNWQGTTLSDEPNGVIADNPNDVVGDPSNDDTPPVHYETHISMDRIFLNEMKALTDAALLWRDPEFFDYMKWDRNAVTDYYGRDLTPAYIPDGLTAAIGNGTASVIADKSGTIVEDTVWLGFFHEYYEDGSPKLTEGVSAKKGFSITVSKIGLLNDCVYILPENEVKTSDIDGTEVTFGYRQMSYGPYDAQTKAPSGYYDMYVAEFEHDGIAYQIVAEQIEVEEVVKVVASIITGKKDIAVDEVK